MAMIGASIFLLVGLAMLFAEPILGLVGYWIEREQRRRDLLAGAEPPSHEHCECQE